MTVSSQTSTATFVGNGVATAFPLPFRFFENGDIRAYFIDSVTGAATQMVLGSDYTLIGAGEPEVDGNALSLLTTTVPLASMRGLYVERVMPQVQETDIVNQGQFFASTHEDVFDRLTMLIQQTNANSAGAILVAIGDPEPSRLVPAEQRANLLMGFDSHGNPIAVAPVSGSASDLATNLANDTDPSKGSGQVGHNPAGGQSAGTVGAALVENASDIAAAEDAIVELEARADAEEEISLSQFSASLSPFVVDMHFGTLRGAGWTAGDPPFVPGVDPYNVKTTTATAAAGTTATDIPVASSTDFTAGMLLAYLATDGRYYSARLHQILAGPIFRLDRTLPAPIAIGGSVHNFYRDDAHPNTIGGACLVDDALRQLNAGRVKSLEWRGNDGAIWSPVLGTTLSSRVDVDYRNPGDATIGERPSLVSGTNANGGVVSSAVALVGGDYQAYVALNFGTRTGNFNNTLTVSVLETRADGQSFTIAFSGLITGFDGTTSVTLDFSVAAGSTVKVQVISVNGGPYSFTVGALEYRKVGGQPLELNRGKHVLFGDSWFTPGSAFATRFIARLDKADVIVSGVGGNKASDLINRFGDVSSQSPDYVWVMVGTNDYYAGVTPQLFEQQILQLRRMIQSIGAQPIFFTPSVGTTTYVGGDRLHPSRRYALNVNYNEVAPAASGPGVVFRNGVANVSNWTVAAGATITAWVFPALTRKVAYLRMLSVSTAAINVRFEYCSAPDGTGGVDPTIYATTNTIRDVPLPRPTDTALRFICIRLNNPSGGAVVVSLTADVCWYQDLV